MPTNPKKKPLSAKEVENIQNNLPAARQRDAINEPWGAAVLGLIATIEQRDANIRELRDALEMARNEYEDLLYRSYYRHPQELVVLNDIDEILAKYDETVPNDLAPTQQNVKGEEESVRDRIKRGLSQTNTRNLGSFQEDE
jgi:hypothetical protein